MMAGRASATVAFLFAGLCLVTSTGLAVMDFVVPAASGGGPIVPLEIVPVALFLWGTPLLGLVVAVRRPENPVGWLLMLTAFGWALSFGVDDLAHRGVGTDLAGALAIAQQVGAVGFLGLFLLLIYFPNGSLPSRRWRILPLAAVVGTAAGAVAGLFAPGSVVDDPPVPELVNPFAQPGWAPVLDLVETFGQLTFVLVVAGSVAVLVTRARRSTGTERQQLKWFVSAGALCALLFVGALIVGTVAPDSALGTALWALGLSSLFLIPLAAAIAILRYRLYDIDRIVSRTIGWTIVTTILAAVFVGLVLVLQTTLAGVTSGQPIAVAASTLVVASVVQPVRRRIQGVVDRRFNRTRYDAERTLTAFAAQLRGDVDLARLSDGIGQVVSDTLAPVAVGVWIRPVGPRSARRHERDVRNELRTKGA